MKFAFVEEDFLVSGGMRRVIELSNRLIERGHEVDILLVLDKPPLECDWLEVKANIKRFRDRGDYDVAIFNHVPVWLVMPRISARLKIYYWLSFEAGYFSISSWYDAYKYDCFVIANSPWVADMAEIIYGKKPPVVLGGINPIHFHPVDVKKEYELLCCAPEDKPEKGWEMMKRAADILGLPLVDFARKNLPQEQLAEEYSKAKLFIAMPTLEGSFCPALEAMACGVPVIMPKVGGNTYYAKHEENCLLLEGRNAGYLIQEIIRLRGDEELQKKLIKDGLETVKAYDWEKTTDDFLKVIEDEFKRKVERKVI